MLVQIRSLFLETSFFPPPEEKIDTASINGKKQTLGLGAGQDYPPKPKITTSQSKSKDLGKNASVLVV